MALHAIEEADFVILGFADARMNSDIHIQPREELLWIYACDEQSSETHMTVLSRMFKRSSCCVSLCVPRSAAVCSADAHACISAIPTSSLSKVAQAFPDNV